MCVDRTEKTAICILYMKEERVKSSDTRSSSPRSNSSLIRGQPWRLKVNGQKVLTRCSRNSF